MGRLLSRIRVWLIAAPSTAAFARDRPQLCLQFSIRFIIIFLSVDVGRVVDI